ncbi:sphinganine kinase lcb4 [Paramarasmius palmivorus]|uniref:Sphinganine kinase lcb4 n=1 Tax=Paramarasmius palmivorus TaxID=297713 RepID=A0AAW0DQ53_9AGAR
MEVEVDVKGKPKQYSVQEESLVITGKFYIHSSKTRVLILPISVNKQAQRIPLYNVISAVFDKDSKSLELKYAARKKKLLAFVEEKGHVKSSEDGAAEFCTTLMEKAYDGVKRNRRLKVLVNPNGGVVRISNHKIRNKYSYTKGNGDAHKIAKNLPLDEFDALLTVSGDGLVHEVLNGFGKHAKPRKALAIPVAPIPAGSGNGLSLNLLGIEDGFNPVAAALNAVKGKPMSIDVFTITQNGQTSLSFMSQALGLMADLDLGTEHLRWMGDSRFIYGFLRGLIKFKSCAVELSYKAAENSKTKMFDTLKTRRASTRPEFLPPPDDMEDMELPGPSTHTLILTAGQHWISQHSSFTLGKVLTSEGTLWLSLSHYLTMASLTYSSRERGHEQTPLRAWTQGPVEASTGGMMFNTFKAHAYRVRPLSTKGCLSIDGERYPFEEFHVEVIPKLATLLSPYGCYAADFEKQKE